MYKNMFLAKALSSIFIIFLVATVAGASTSETKTLKAKGFFLHITPKRLELRGDRYVKASPVYINAQLLTAEIDRAFFSGGFINLGGIGEWVITEMEPKRYAVRYKTWEDFFWEVDVENKKIYKVTGVVFGAKGGSRKHLPGAIFKFTGKTFNVFFVPARVEMVPGSRKLEIFCGDALVHRTGIMRTERTGKNKYEVVVRRIKHLAAMELDFINQTVNPIQPDTVFERRSPLPFTKPLNNDIYHYYGSINFTISPGQTHYDLNGKKKTFSPSIETHLDNFVLSYGKNWKVVAAGDDIYMMQYKKWKSDIFLKADIKHETLYVVKGGIFGTGGGTETLIPGMVFKAYYMKTYNTYNFIFPKGRMDFIPKTDRLVIYAGDLILHEGSVLQWDNVDTDVYTITHKLAQGRTITWKMDFAMENLELGATNLRDTTAQKKPPQAHAAGKDKTYLREPMLYGSKTKDFRVTDIDSGLVKKTGKVRENDFAVVIGNFKYNNVEEVRYAQADVMLMEQYLVNAMGFRKGNIFLLRNATKGQFEMHFGTESNYKGKLFNNIVPGKSNVFIYYSGHGAPGLKDHRAYFVPVEADPNYLELGGYPLDVFYKNLAKLPAKHITVVLDSCFSGANLYEKISPIIVKTKMPPSPAGNIVVMSSSTGTQVSGWYEKMHHSMFTYFFLKGILKGNADKDGDRQLTYEEIFAFVSDKTHGVPYYARSINGIEQTPVIQGDYKGKVLLEY